MAIFSVDTAVRRTITLPRKVDGKDLLALIEVGGKILNKEVIYEMFFKTAYTSVKKKILEAFLSRGGTEAEFRRLLHDATGIVNTKISNRKNIRKGSPK